jgi:hypothetical protein
MLFVRGHYVFDAFPLLAIPFLPLFPVIQLLNLPFVSFGIFILLFNFVARNTIFSRLVRFNTLQVIQISRERESVREGGGKWAGRGLQIWKREEEGRGG